MKYVNLILAALLLVAGISFAGCLGGDDAGGEKNGTPDVSASSSAKDPVIGTWEGYDRHGKIQVSFKESGIVVITFRDQPSFEKTWTFDNGVYRIWDDDGYNSANVEIQNDDTIQYTTSGAVMFSMTRVA